MNLQGVIYRSRIDTCDEKIVKTVLVKETVLEQPWHSDQFEFMKVFLVFINLVPFDGERSLSRSFFGLFFQLRLTLPVTGHQSPVYKRLLLNLVTGHQSPVCKRLVPHRQVTLKCIITFVPLLDLSVPCAGKRFNSPCCVAWRRRPERAVLHNVLVLVSI